MPVKFHGDQNVEVNLATLSYGDVTGFKKVVSVIFSNIYIYIYGKADVGGDHNLLVVTTNIIYIYIYIYGKADFGGDHNLLVAKMTLKQRNAKIGTAGNQ